MATDRNILITRIGLTGSLVEAIEAATNEAQKMAKRLSNEIDKAIIETLQKELPFRLPRKIKKVMSKYGANTVYGYDYNQRSYNIFHRRYTIHRGERQRRDKVLNPIPGIDLDLMYRLMDAKTTGIKYITIPPYEGPITPYNRPLE